MIRAVFGHGGGEAAFLAAAAAQPLPGIELASAWYAFGKGQARGAQGWHFFAAGEDEPPFALALRRGTAWACGPHDPEELGEFLRWAGVSRLTARLSGTDAPSFAACPDGFSPAERMLGLLRPYGGRGQRSTGESADTLAGAGSAARPPAYEQGSAPRGAPVPFPAGYRLTGKTDAARLAEFLRQEGVFGPVQQPGLQAASAACAAKTPAALPDQAVLADVPADAGPSAAAGDAEAAEQQAQQAAARLFAQELDARAAIGLGYAAVLEEAPSPRAGAGPKALPPHIAAVMAVSSAPHVGVVCLSALQTRADLRGQGLGSRMVQALASEAGHFARGVCLLCRPERAGFYARLGFAPEGEYACFVSVR